MKLEKCRNNWTAINTNKRTTTLTPGQNSFELTNTGAIPLTYDLAVYEIASTPYAWAGASDAMGSWDSHIWLDFPAAAIYDFDFARTSGRYQFMVDDEHIQKTVDADDTVGYYIPAGMHQLKVVPDRTGANASWTLDLSAPGAASDTLPYEKDGGDLWAGAANFNEEWLPINLAADTAVNFEFSLAGTAGDKLDVYLYDAADTVVYTVTDVYAGETLWWTTDLAAGVSCINLQTDASNSASLTYDLAIHDKPALAADWAGVSNAIGNNSVVRFEAPTAGLYDFNYGVAGGRYQFLVDSDTLIQKTAEVSDTVRYYLDAGTHELTIVQDTTSGVEWCFSKRLLPHKC
jgi:hypothetical protein